MWDKIKIFIMRISGHYGHIRGKARNHAPADLAWRLSVLLIGITVVLVGVLFLVVPGPGWPVIIIGLIFLATEFQWARRMLDPVQRASTKFNASYKERTSQRTRAIVLLVIIALGGLSIFITIAKFI